MRSIHTNGSSLIAAAQAGDRRALDELVTVYLPLAYTIVRRALGGHPEVDDVVQEIMLRALRRLGALRTPESFRTWLATIAVHEVSRYLRQEHATADRTAALDEVAELPDIGADVESLTLLRTELSAQRQQVARAGQWLGPGDRVLLSLWWLEVAGQLTRSELAAALGVSATHAGVRVQRMRDQLDLCRSVVAALCARPRCAGLGAMVAEWDGVPSPLWRKRIGHHTRSCTACLRATHGMVAAERLLIGIALLPVPAALTAALLGKSAFTAAAGATATAASGAPGAGASYGAGARVKARLFSKLGQAVRARPVVGAIAAGTVIIVGAVTVTHWPKPASPGPLAVSSVSASPSPTMSRTTPTQAMPTQATPTKTTTSVSSGHFGLLAPGAKLPSGAQCAAAVRAVAIAENKAVNASANHIVGHSVAGASAPVGRVDGNFTGTTGQILRWASCKWGIDEDVVKAQAAIESWWHMDNKGDWGTDATRCPANHGLGVDGAAGKCPESYGMLQVRYPYNMAAFPGVDKSTAMNADYAYAVWRSCYEGQMTWLNTVERGSDYKPGDAWGCLGVWFSGRWHTAAAEGYITRVKDYLAQRIWQTPNFQQP